MQSTSPVPEEIWIKLRQVRVFIWRGWRASDAIRIVGVAPSIYYEWRKRFAQSKSPRIVRIRKISSVWAR